MEVAAGPSSLEVVEAFDEFMMSCQAFNAANDEYENLVEAGVVDPTKVVRTALQNAASVAGLMRTTEALVAELPKEEKEAGGGHGHGGPGMDF